jgi:peroxiredoxin
MMEIATLPKTGSAMPDLDLVGPDGASTTLRAVRDGRRAIVFFMRAAQCPACLSHARTIAGLSERGDVQALLVTPGDAAAAARLAARRTEPSVSVWSSASAHRVSGLGKFLRLQHSGTFVLDVDDTIIYRRTSALPVRSFDRAETLAALRET